jgi:hypothetical protein
MKKIETTSEAIILFVVWGSAHLQKLIQKIKDGAYPKIPMHLLTDRKSIIGDENFFEVIHRTDFEFNNHLRKSEMYKAFPKDEKTILFLDIDTTVLADISFGFEKARKHGMAISPATQYSLQDYRVFDQVMKQENILPQGQIAYNSGVIFFHLTSEVKDVMAEWHSLCSKYRDQYTSDQSFLTLAMEKRSFNPYTLSTSYNHRAFGELICGKVIIWHSRLPVPAQLNHERDPFYWKIKSGYLSRHFPKNVGLSLKIKAWMQYWLDRLIH